MLRPLKRLREDYNWRLGRSDHRDLELLRCFAGTDIGNRVPTTGRQFRHLEYSLCVDRLSADGSVVVDDPSRPSFERFTKLILLVIFVD